MADTTVLELDRLPSIAPAFLRAAMNFSGGLREGETVPAIEASIDGLTADSARVAKYARVCGFDVRGHLPVTFPHILAFPVHMAVLTHRDFPLKLLGLVHVRNSITQHRDIAVEEALDLKVRVGGHRPARGGVEFDLVTQVADRDGGMLWESSSTMLSRGKGTGERSGRGQRKAPSVPEYGRYATWDAPADIGRQYALVSGDVNPIHLSSLSAKLFGFPRALAHGMWLKARASAEIADEIRKPHYTLEVAFKRPVLLPSPVLLKYHSGDEGIDFALMNPDGDTVHMTGAVTYR